MDNNYILYVSLNVLNRRMSAFIEDRLREIYGENWWVEGVEKAVSQSPATLGARKILSLEHYLPLIEHYWQQCFAGTFGDIGKVTGWLNDIMNMRDRISPGYPSLSDEDTWSYLDMMETLAGCIDTTYASEINRLKNDIEGMQKTTDHIDLKNITGDSHINNLDDIEKLLSAKEKIEKQIQEKYCKCITVMFTDLQDSTGLTQKVGDIKARLVITKHDNIVIPLIKSTGTFIKSIGDGTLSYFCSADDALSVAIQIQEDLKCFNDKREFNTPIRLRIGLHTGECIVEHNDIRGNIVNIASRFESLSSPDEIFLSENTYNALSSENKELCRYLYTTAIKGITDEKFKVYKVTSDEQEEMVSEACLPSLQIKDSPEDVVYIKSEEVLIGRAGECNLRLEDSYISRRHARVYLKQDSYYIEDLNSKFGVSVNGCKISEQRLNSGDIILLGKKTIIFTNPAQEDDNKTIAAPVMENIGTKSGRFILVRITSPGETKEHCTLTSQGVSIGRKGGNNTVVLDDFSVSKNHARVWLEKGKVYVEDLNSTNGTFVGEQMIPAGEAFELSTGNNLKIGTSQFMVFDTDNTMDSDML
ncbi:MAG: FHA domain-containing protein [Nitrospirae bacterium]|nr:FHA domain-containing protein [Nitrospirota bacterium]